MMTGLLRPLAHGLISRRNGFGGWQQHRAAFRALVAQDAAGVERHSLAALARVLAHAYANVPLYRERWTAIGYAPSPAVTLNELRQLPLLTKADIRDRKTELVASNVPSRTLQLDYTGGTTGTQTSFYRDNECRVARFGRQWGVLEQCGYRPGDKRALIWGAHADLETPKGAHRIKQWARQFASADEAICCTVMTRDQMLAYHRRLRAFRPKVIYGYPNAIEQFATFVERHLVPITVQRVLCTAERLRDHQRELFQRVFGGEVFDLYCSREHGCAGFECRSHDRYHLDAGSVIVEILRDGLPARPGESGEIVVTDLLNRGMPFIRYVTGDVATASEGPCACGSPLPTFSSLDGRTADMLYRPDGSRVAGLMLDDLFMDLPAVTHAQFVQHDAASLDVKVIARGGATGHLRAAMAAEVCSIMGPDVAVRIHFVDDIPRNPRSGKFQTVICHLPARHGAHGVPLCS
jgi:phenylacetate-CoA ligase